MQTTFEPGEIRGIIAQIEHLIDDAQAVLTTFRAMAQPDKTPQPPSRPGKPAYATPAPVAAAEGAAVDLEVMNRGQLMQLCVDRGYTPEDVKGKPVLELRKMAQTAIEAGEAAPEPEQEEEEVPDAPEEVPEAPEPEAPPVRKMAPPRPVMPSMPTPQKPAISAFKLPRRI